MKYATKLYGRTWYSSKTLCYFEEVLNCMKGMQSFPLKWVIRNCIGKCILCFFAIRPEAEMKF